MTTKHELFPEQYAHPLVGGLRLSACAILPEDLKDSFDLCQKGTFYESLMTDEERARGNKHRSKMKVRFYRVLFGRNHSKNPRFPNEVRRRFRRRHPTLARTLKTFKARNYKHSSFLLQNFEATLFIHRICGRIMKERFQAFVLTKHDSILTTPAEAEFVLSIMKDEFAKLGTTVTITRKDHK
jgi:hypothetical protein